MPPAVQRVVPPAASPAAPRGAPPRFAVNAAIVWLFGVIVRSALFVLITGSVLQVPSLRWLERLGLLGYRFVASVPGVLVLAGAITLAQVSSRRGGLAGRALAAVSLCVVYGIQLFTFASWAAFRSTGQFLDVESLTLWFSSESLVLAHVAQVEAWMIAAVPVAAGLSLFAIAWLCDRATRWSSSRSRVLVASVSGVLVVSIAGAWRADVMTRTDVGRVVTRVGEVGEPAQDAFRIAAAERSGPIARVMASLWEGVSQAGARAGFWPLSPEFGARQVSLADYAKLADPRRTRRWNVLFIVVESLRADELTAFGGRRPAMPAVDSLARESVVYTNVIAQATQSDYATTSLLSSQYPLRNAKYRTFPLSIPYPRVLLYDILKSLGWRTAVFSSQNERWAGMYNFLNTGGIDHFLHSETYHGATYAPPTDSGFLAWMRTARMAGKIDDHDTIDEALAWTDSLAPGVPFFAYINLQSSHTPYTRPARFPPRFGSGRVSFPILFGSYPADSVGAVRDMYDNSLAYADAQLWRLFDYLKESGRWDSTLVVVTGYHGEAFLEHGFVAHGSELFREVTHVPVVVRIPGGAHAADTLPASQIDIAPTLLGLLQLPPHPGFQGRDLADVGDRLHRPIFSLSQGPLADEAAVEQDGWKLLLDLRHSTRLLFDLRADPAETRDVGDANPAQRDALERLIATWWTTQLDYYRSPERMASRYAPRGPGAAELGREGKR